MATQKNTSLADSLYKNGEFEQAFKLYENLAEKGDATAQGKIGRMYDDGLGIKEDLSKAAFWYEQAAKQGISSSQFNLAGLYLYGEGVTKSWEKAYYWYRKVANNGDEEAKQKLTEIQDASSPEDPSEKPFGYHFLVDNIDFEDLNAALWQLIPQDTDVIKEDLMRYLNRNWPTEAHQAINLALQEDYVAPELTHYWDVLDNDNGYNYLADVYEFVLTELSK
jgi:TPR repeat protein